MLHVLQTVVDISHFYITWEISNQFSRRNLKPMAFLVTFSKHLHLQQIATV